MKSKLILDKNPKTVLYCYLESQVRAEKRDNGYDPDHMEDCKKFWKDRLSDA